MNYIDTSCSTWEQVANIFSVLVFICSMFAIEFRRFRYDRRRRRGEKCWIQFVCCWEKACAYLTWARFYLCVCAVVDFLDLRRISYDSGEDEPKFDWIRFLLSKWSEFCVCKIHFDLVNVFDEKRHAREFSLVDGIRFFPLRQHSLLKAFLVNRILLFSDHVKFIKKKSILICYRLKMTNDDDKPWLCTTCYCIAKQMNRTATIHLNEDTANDWRIFRAKTVENKRNFILPRLNAVGIWIDGWINREIDADKHT